MATTVYRIEDKDGYGMYGSGHAPLGLYDNERHPGPEDDGLLRSKVEQRVGAGSYYDFRISDYHFGFGSVEQLRNWLYNDEWLQELHDKGLVLAIIETEDAIVGHTQAIFIRPDMYQTVSIKDYFNL